MTKRDKLFILEPGFEDPAYPEKLFYCWHCTLMEGLLASFPDLAEQIDVERIGWPKPRTQLAGLIGEGHQSVPALVFGAEPPKEIKVKNHNGVLFIDDKDEILRAFTIKYGIPHPHP